MTIFIDWKQWHEGDKLDLAYGETVLVCILRRVGMYGTYPYIVANCLNCTGKATDWECFLGRTRKRMSLTKKVDYVDFYGKKIIREIFKPEKDLLFYAREEFFRMPPNVFPGEKGEEMKAPISELFYCPGEVSGQEIGKTI